MGHTDRYVRDLLWAANSPDLVCLDPAVDADHARVNVEEHLDVGDIDADHLTQQVDRPEEHRVGRYFERLIVYWVEFIRGCEIVAQGLPIRVGKRTIGEIDLIFRDESGQLIHWEIAVKFYLQVETGQPPVTQYVGPNANDTLKRKTSRLRDHQLPLSRQYFPDVAIRRAFVKGRIFYHWKEGHNGLTTSLLSPDHLVGQWLRANEAEEFLQANPLNYRVLPKPFWLSEELVHALDESVRSANEMEVKLTNHFSHGGRPILISGFPTGDLPVRECNRIFVVPDDWPS